MKRVVLLLVVATAFLAGINRRAQAQRSGSVQATARVVDRSEGWDGLQSVRVLALLLPTAQHRSATVETKLAQVSLHWVKRPAEHPGVPPALTFTVNYLRN